MVSPPLSSTFSIYSPKPGAIPSSTIPLSLVVLCGESSRGVTVTSWWRKRKLGRSGRFLLPRKAVDKEPAHFEVDGEKAREALEKLDQQLQTLSQRETAKPKQKNPKPVSTSYKTDHSNVDMRKELPQISGPFLAYSALALLILTFFNNVIFTFIIKPYVDGN